MQTFGAEIPKSLNAVRAWLEKQGVALAGTPFIRYNVIDMERELDVEIGWPVAIRMMGEEPISAGVFPAGRYATAIHTGPYDELMAATASLLDWAEKHGIVWDCWPTDKGEAWGARFEFYPTDPVADPDPAKWQTELVFKLADSQSKS
jgi:hypothetical protein